MADPTHDDTRPDESTTSGAEGQRSYGGQRSEGPSGFSGTETAVGGADAVPDTPDVNPGTSAPIQGSGADGS